MKNVNERFIQVRGKAVVNDELDYDQDLGVTVVVTNIDDKDNGDGTVDRTYKCKLFVAEPPSEMVEVAKNTKSRSKRLRERLWVLWDRDYKTKIEFQEFYNKAYDKYEDQVSELLKEE